MASKSKLTDAFVRSVKPPTKGRDEYWDTEVSHFLLRVTPNGAKSYVLYLRWPGSPVPARRTVADAAKVSLAKARTIAREWLALVEQAIDPREQARREAEAVARERAITFKAMAEDFILEDLAGKRRGPRDAQEIRREIIVRWGKLPATSITAGHVLELAKDLKHKPATGRLILSHIKRIFAWALHEHDKVHGNRYGLKDNPAVAISPKRVFGEKKPRQRTLDDDELRALLVACREVPYPVGPCVELLLHTGCRREEIAQAQWPEYDLKSRTLIVPPSRFKSDVEHRVPLSQDASALFESLPQHTGPYIFTTTLGKKPINGWSNAKEEIDRVMERELGFEPKHWIFHDLRHVVRTRMAALGVDDKVAEMVLGHAKRGMERVYNEHKYQNEIRGAYETWAALLRELASPRTAKSAATKPNRTRGKQR
jgi:integrase